MASHIVDKEKRIIIVFRFDDFSSRSSTDIEIKLIEAFRNHNLSATFGVVPYVCTGDYHDVHPQDFRPLTVEKVEILKDAIKAGILEAALHGYSHQTFRSEADGGYSEFSGLDYKDQLKKISSGKNCLEEMLGIQAATFIPPWNKYDNNTLLALEELGIKTISASLRGSILESSRLNFLPETCFLNRLKAAVELARGLPEKRPVIVVVLHEYDFPDPKDEKKGHVYREFEELLKWLASQKDICARTIDQTTKIVPDLSAHRLKINSFYFRRWWADLAPPLKRLAPKVVYLSQKTACTVKRNHLTALLFFYLTLLMVSGVITFLGGSILFPRAWLLAFACKYGFATLLVLALAYSLYSRTFSYKRAMVIVILLGACISAWALF